MKDMKKGALIGGLVGIFVLVAAYVVSHVAPVTPGANGATGKTTVAR